MNKIICICAASALALGVPVHGATTVNSGTTVPSVDVAVTNPADIGSTGPVISITVGSTQQLDLISIVGNFPWGFTFANPTLPGFAGNAALAPNIIGLPRGATTAPTVRCTPTLNYRVGSSRSAGSSTTTINAFTSGCNGARVDLRSALRQDQLGIVLGFANAPVIASNRWDGGSNASGGNSGNGANEVFRLSFAPAAAAVPESASWLMMIAGFMTIGLMMRRQRRRLAAPLYSA